RAIVAWLFIAACVVASIWLGRRGPGPGTWGRLGLIAVNLVVAVVAVQFVADRDVLAATGGSYPADDGGGYDPAHGISNLYPYGPDGQPLSGVRIIDQNGHPVNIGDAYACPAATYGPEPTPIATFTYPLCAPGPSPSLSPLPSVASSP